MSKYLLSPDLIVGLAYVLFPLSSVLLWHTGWALVYCNVEGSCVGELLKSLAVDTAYECDRECGELSQCKWYSFVQGTRQCSLLKSCAQIDYDCNGYQCEFGQKDCHKKFSPTCGVKGECIGNPKDAMIANNVSMCEQHCYEHRACLWYNFKEAIKVCVMLEDCYGLQFLCVHRNCVYGQKACHISRN